jgi:hypothetical protein
MFEFCWSVYHGPGRYNGSLRSETPGLSTVDLSPGKRQSKFEVRTLSLF